MKKNIHKYTSGNVILKQQGELGCLVLGDCNSAVDQAILKLNKIKTIISIGLQAQPNKNKIPQDTTHHVYDIHDNKQQKLSVELLDEVVNKIQQGRKNGGILIHCYAGVSRSSSFTIAYIMFKKKLSYDKAKQKVKKYRPCIHPGDGFVRQLQYYQKILMKRQEQRLAQLQNNQYSKQIKQQEKQQISNKSIQKVEKIKRGVKGAVKSAEFILPSSLKNSLNVNNSSKIQQQTYEEPQITANKQEQNTKQYKLPRIISKNHKNDINSSRYQKSNSKMQLRQEIDKIQTKKISTNINISSIKSIYGNKVKIV